MADTATVRMSTPSAQAYQILHLAYTSRQS